MPGGKEIHVAELTKVQRERGSRIHLIYESGDASGLGCPSTRVRLPRFLSGEGFLGEIVWSCFAIRSIKRELHASDLLHIHGDIGNLPIPLLLREKPVVVTLHGSLNLRYKGLHRRLAQNVAAIFCIGDETKRQLMSCGVAPVKLHPTSSGVRKEIFSLGARDLKQAATEKFRVVSIGKLSLLKNHATVITAVAELRPSIPCSVKIVGRGPLRAELTELAARLGVELELVESASADEIARILRESNVFVLPSKRFTSMGEGLATALLEALAVGVPCCVSVEALPTSSIVGPECFIPFHPLSPTDLAESLRQVLEGGAQIHKMVSAGLKAARARSWDAVASEVEDTMESTISRGQPTER